MFIQLSFAFADFQFGLNTKHRFAVLSTGLHTHVFVDVLYAKARHETVLVGILELDITPREEVTRTDLHMCFNTSLLSLT
jgi:hypothetical protein